MEDRVNWIGQVVSFKEDPKGEDYPVIFIIEGKEFCSNKNPDYENASTISDYDVASIGGELVCRFELKYLDVDSIEEKHLVGGLEGFPIEVVKGMMFFQKEERGSTDITVFQEKVDSDSEEGGFNWSETLLEDTSISPWDFWNEVIIGRNFEYYFKVQDPEMLWKKEEAQDIQIENQAKLNQAGYNLVSCGKCDTVLIHKLDEVSVVCPNCLKANSPNDCVDLYYEGMP